MSTICPKCHTENTLGSKFCSSCGLLLDPIDKIPVSQTKTIETPIEKLSTGTTFAGRYQIIEELGKGGMGRVYRVLDKELDEEIAIKLIKPDIASDKKTVERFKNELKLARKISQKNVGKMYELLDDKGTKFITMEYVSGGDLKKFIRRSGQMGIGKAISIAKQICGGLEEAHSLGIVHRDLKPNNIMIDDNGNARIMDFGIARTLKEKGITGSGIMIGTPDYMSPEQAEAKEIDQRSDIYSLGIILYEMLTGRLPFEGETPLAVAMKHKGETPKDPKEFNSQISDDLSRIILKCLEKEKEKRFQNAGDVQAELEKIEAGLPTTHRAASDTKPVTSREITIHFEIKRFLLPIVVLAVLLVAGVAIWQFVLKKDTIKPTIAVVNFDNETEDTSFDYLRNIIPNLLITSLDQSGNFYMMTWDRMYDLIEQMDKKGIEFIDRELGFELCRREAIDAIILGSFTKAGNIFATNLQVLDVQTKKLLDSASSRGQGPESILAGQIDDLSRQISRGFGISKRRVEKSQKRIVDLTTASIEAYDFYLKGKDQLDRLLFEDAQKSLEKAIELDPQFAIAYIELALTYRLQGKNSACNEKLEKALELSEKTTEREKLYIELVYYSEVNADTDRCLSIVEQAIAKYPDDKRFHYWAGLVDRYTGQYSHAIEEFNKSLELDPNQGSVHNFLGWVYIRIGEYEKALSHFKANASLQPHDASPVDSQASLYFLMGELDRAVSKYEEAMKIQPEDYARVNWRLAYIYAFKEDYQKAMDYVDKYIDGSKSPGWKEAGLVLKEFYNYWLGRPDLALVNLQLIIQKAEDLGNFLWKAHAEWLLSWIYYDRGELEIGRKLLKNNVEYLIKDEPGFAAFHQAQYKFYLGLFDIKEGNLVQARNRLEEIKILENKVVSLRYKPIVENRSTLLKAEILLAEDSGNEALTVWEDQLPLTYLGGIGPEQTFLENLPVLFDIHARAYKSLGETDKAIEEYERLTSFRPQTRDRRLISPDYYYRLAELYEKKGNFSKAIVTYEKFLDLWKEADPGLPEVADARKKLAGLRE